MLGIETRLSTALHSQIDGQTEHINQKLEQYLWFFIDHKQKNWPEWLVSAEFAVNDNIYLATKEYPFMANYRRELQMGADIRRKGKAEKAMEFIKEIKRIQKEISIALKRAQKKIKIQVDKEKREVKV